jgi:LPS export ABC transporter permease LptG/LPS export ABC transporter permease LptF
VFKIFDRYIVREILLPFVLALLVLTFLLMMPPILTQGAQLIEKGVGLATVARILLTLTPQALAVTIPMALLYGILIGLGRLSADREFVALQACGVSIFRALRPLAVLALVAFGADLYVLLVAVPDSNQTFREITFNVVASKAESDVKPRAFFTAFTDRVLYVRDVLSVGGWRDVFLVDATRSDQRAVYFATEGRLLVDHDKRTVQLVLEHGTQHTTFTARPEDDDNTSFDRVILNMEADTVFPRVTLIKGDNEMTIAELRATVADHAAHGAPFASQLFTIQQKYSIPVSCLVLAAIGLALGASNRKDGTLASFALGSGVIFAYYILLYSSRAAATGGRLSPTLAPWVVNIVLGIAGIVLMLWRSGLASGSIRVSLPALPSFGRSRAATGAGLDRTGARRVVLVIRLPRIHWPRPSLLDLYVSRQYLAVFALTFASLIGVFYIATFIDLADKLFRGSTTGVMLVRFFYFKTPEYVYYIIPLSALIATLVTIGLLTRNSELIVMRACGISLYRSAMPLLVFAVIFSGALFEMQERVLAESNRHAKELEAVIRGWPVPAFVGVLNRRWMVGAQGDIYNYEMFDSRANRFTRLWIFHPDPANWRLERLTFAQDATAGKAADDAQPDWTATRGWTREFTTAKAGGVVRPVVNYQPFATRTITFERPAFFKTEEPDADRMTYGELKRYVTQLQASGYYVVPDLVQLQKKVAFPFVTLIMTLLGVPFAVTTGRSGAMYGIGIGIALAITYWTALNIFVALGSAAVISPVLAAWSPNILFGAAALYMLLTVRT